MSEDDRSGQDTISANGEDEGATRWYERPPWSVFLVLLGLFVLLLGVAAALRAMVVPTAFPPLIDAIAWPGFWLVTVMVIFLMFQAEIRAFLGEIYAVDTPWLRLFRAAKAAAGEKDVPLPPPSGRQQVLNEWQKVHNRLTELYEEKVGRTPPARYRPLASRLKSQGHVSGNTAVLLDEVRDIQRRVKRRPDWSVSPQRAEYYATIVSLLLGLLANSKASSS